MSGTKRTDERQTRNKNNDDSEIEDSDGEEIKNATTLQTNRKMQELLKKVENLKKKIEDLTDTVQYLTQENEDLKSDNKKNKENMKQEIQQIEKSNNRVQKDTEKMKTEQNKDRQYDRNRNIEIFGLVKKDKEDLPKVLKKMANIMEIEEYDETKIEAIHRIPQREPRIPGNRKDTNKTETIIVQFATRVERNKWIQKRTRLTNEQILGIEDKSYVYVNEHLTSENKILLWQAKQKAKEKNWKYVWYKEGKILCRRTDGETVVAIEVEEDLKKIKNKKDKTNNSDADEDNN